jgi:hypothetical protein
MRIKLIVASVLAMPILAGCLSITGDGLTDGGGDGGSEGDGDGDATLTCTLVDPPIAKALFNVGTMGAIDTPGSVPVVGLLSGGQGPLYATWQQDGGFQSFTSPEIAAGPSQWDAAFEYSSATGWPDECPATEAVCNAVDILRFSFIDNHTDAQSIFTRTARASLCVDINRTSAVCPLPLSIESITATPDPEDPTTLEFGVTLTHPEIDCNGIESFNGLTYNWSINGGTNGVYSDTETAVLTFTDPNINGAYFSGSLEVVCSRSYDNNGITQTIDLRASTEFYIDCQ